MLPLLAQIPNPTSVPLQVPNVEWKATAPLLVLLGGATLLLVVSALSRRRPAPGVYALWTCVVAGGAVAAAVPLWREVTDPQRGPFTVINGALGIDGFSIFLTFVIAFSVILAALLADGYLRREGINGPEPYVLMLLSASGGLVMAMANDLIVTFLGLEILSIAVYVLAAMHPRKATSQEAGMKYFVLGAFSSAFFLYGVALVYGSVGSTNLGRIAGYTPAGKPFGSSVTVSQILSGARTPALLLAGFALLLVGFGFKVAAAPFHSWTPDVYQGAPTPSVVYMASGVKAAGFAGLLRVFVVAFGGYKADWQPFVYALAVATLLVGAVLAVVQTDVKRMMAYSSISHAGFILVAVEAGSIDGIAAALFYLASYTFMIAGAFGVITVLARRGDGPTSLDDLKGLAKREPVLAFAFTVFLLAQLGVPLTSGFFAKFYVIAAAVDAGYWHLGLVAMVSAVIAAFVYLRIVVNMYMAGDSGESTAEEAQRGAPPGPRLRIPFGAKLALGLAFVATLALGILPGPLADSSQDARPTVTAQSR